MKLSIGTKIFLVICCFAAAGAGFMLKLPAVFRHVDKELHSLFYFLAAAFLNILFTNKRIGVHISIFIILYLLGVTIEYAQEYSNSFLHKRIHGRYDPVDVKANLKGLLIYSGIWVVYVSCWFLNNRLKEKDTKISTE